MTAGSLEVRESESYVGEGGREGERKVVIPCEALSCLMLSASTCGRRN